MTLALAPDERSEDFTSTIVETARLVLRKPTCADAPTLALLANDVRVAENLGTLPHPYGQDDARAFIENTEVSSSRVNFGIYLKRPDGLDFTGIIGLMPRDGEKYNIGYWLGQPYWGQGLATEAARALVDFAFMHFDAPAISGSSRVTNGASRRVMEKCGFQYVGQGMGPSLFYRGMVPVDRFRLERRVWQSLKEWRDASVARTEVPS